MICPDCLTKDYCECVKAALREWRIQRRDKAVTAVSRALKKHKVTYQATSVANVVLITRTSQPDVFLSLKSEQDDAGYTIYKYRISGNQQWMKLKRDTFFAWLVKLTPSTQQSPAQSVVTMTFGKHQGKNLVEAVAKDYGYFRWLYDECNIPTDLRHTLAGLL